MKPHCLIPRCELASQIYLDLGRNAGAMPAIKLSNRETEVAILAGRGLLNKEIAAQLGISPFTVGVHKNNIYKKLGICNNVELLPYLQKTGILDV